MIYVDGHNTLHVVPELRDVMKRDMVTAMQRLIGRVQREENVIVVFDGNPPSPFTTTNPRIVFANAIDKKFERADEYILSKVRNDPHATVITKDSAFASTVRQLGVKVIDPVEWFGSSEKKVQLKSHKNSKSANDETKRGPGGTNSEWIEKFKRGKGEEE